jgi:hypothetical protein
LGTRPQKVFFDLSVFGLKVLLLLFVDVIQSQWFGSVTFWCGSGSAEPIRTTDLRDLDSGWGKNPYGSGINILDLISEILVADFWVKKFLNSGSATFNNELQPDCLANRGYILFATLIGYW